MAKATMTTRKELIQRNKAAYSKARKKEKSKILDSICNNTGLSRDRVRRLLNATTYKKLRKRRSGRKPKYDKQFVLFLEKVWAFMDFACGRRLVAGMPDMLEALISYGEFQASEDILNKLRTVSAATADRLLSKAKKGLTLKGKSTTKPGTLLKKSIPVRLGTEWDDAVPGFVEIDLVAHCGVTTIGDYVNTLSVTDVSSGWTENATVLNKAQAHVFMAIIDIRQRLPFPLKGIDSDNGGEFINAHLFRWCKQENILFTRSRPNRKNDNCYVEQKNWHVVRRNIGYVRYEGQEAVDVMNRYYALLRLYNNFFIPQTKLIEKTRTDARVHKKYEKPKTPYRRLMDSDTISSEAKLAMIETYNTLNPAALQREMICVLDQLKALHV